MNIKKLFTKDSKVKIRTKEELLVRKNEFLRICEILDELKITYFLDTGILLGAVRHNGFIPWDWDVELSVFSADTYNKIDILIDILSKKGFKIEKYYKELSKLKIDFTGKLPGEVNKYTIQGWNHDKIKKIFWRTSYKNPEHFITNMKKIELFDRYHYAPYPLEEYLKFKYGNWKKPLQTSNKYIYMRKEFSGKNLIKDAYNKILIKLFK